MDSINNNMASKMLQECMNSVGNNQVQHVSNKANGNFACDKIGAYNVSQDVVNKIFSHGSFFDDMAVFKDMIGTAQDAFSRMQVQGEGILALINKAHDGEQTPESMSAINSEVFAKMAEIDKIYKSADFNGVNPFENVFGFNIPSSVGGFNAADFLRSVCNVPAEGVNGVSEGVNKTEEKEITEELASIDVNVDMSAFFGDSVQSSEFGMQMAATIKMGFCDDGSFQISVDASLDYDLSELSKHGAESDNAFDIINNFLSLISGKQAQLGYASDFMDQIFESIFASMDEFGSGDVVQESSSELKGKILQHATINLDGANQMPNIAINIL